MLNICITFDYEVFLGKNNASYQEILFLPTQNLLNTLYSLKVSGTFFADVCSVEAHSRLGDNGYCNCFTEQIKDLIQHNQDVQLHLHTNWINAKIIDGKIIPGNDGYRIHSFGFGNEGNANAIIRKGKEYLENVCREINPNYKCIAFRAGGFSVQPEKELFRALVENGIIIDSSVVPRMKANTVNYYDFSQTPNKVNWWIDPEVGISKESRRSDKTIYEIPVATARPRLLQLIGKSKNELGLPPHKVLGEYVSCGKIQKRNYFVRQFHRLFDYRYISLDTRYYLRIMEDLDYLYHHFKMNQNDGFISLISHPKLADQSRVDNLKKLIIEIQRYPDKYSIVNFSDVFNSIS